MHRQNLEEPSQFLKGVGILNLNGLLKILTRYVSAVKLLVPVMVVILGRAGRHHQW